MNFTAPMLESMLVRLLRTPAAMQEAAGLLRVEHFMLPAEQHYALLWKSMLDVYHKYGQLTYATLYDVIQMEASQLSDFPQHLLCDLLSDRDPAGLLYFAYNGVDAADLEIDLTRQYVRNFLRERYVFAPLVSSLARGVGSDLPEILLEAADRHQRLAQVDKFPVVAALPENWHQSITPREMESTGVPFLDEFTDGGHSAGDTNGILGPMGVGKTTLAVTLAVGCSSIQLSKRVEQMKAHLPITPYKIVYFVTYEQSAEDIQILLRANAAKILTSRLASMRNPEMDLSSCINGNFQPYELALHAAEYRDQSAVNQQPGELERLMAAAPLLRDIIQIVDLSGVGVNSRTGDGFVDEVAALINLDQQKRNNPGVACVIVDYVLLAVKRWLQRENKAEDKHLRHAVASYVDRMRLSVAGRLRTPVWLLSQLNNEGNKGDPTKLTSHTQAAESSAFAAPLVYCACIGTKDIVSRCALINFSKTRRSAGLPSPKIMYINGAMGRMEDGTGIYAIDYNQRRIRTIEELGQVSDVEAPVAIHTPDNRSVSALLTEYRNRIQSANPSL